MINKYFKRGMWFVECKDCTRCGGGKKRFVTEAEADAFIASCSDTPAPVAVEEPLFSTSWLEDIDDAYEEEESN
jgi:hypothetical protein